MSKVDNSYIQEMKIWIEQQKLRLKSCELAKIEWFSCIKNLRDLIVLENKQISIIRKSIRRNEKEFQKYLDANLLKKEKVL